MRIISLLTLLWLFGRFATSNEECRLDEMQDFLSTSADFGVLYSGGCDSVFSPRVSENCCATLSEILTDKCAAEVFTLFDDHSYGSAFYSFLTSVLRKCRLEASIGYNLTGCPDGVVTGEEQCDDGNAISGDGCSSYCFVEDGYDCFPDNNGTSVCWQCEEECYLQYRESCESPGEACGDCLEGFELSPEGHCAELKHLFYVAVPTYSENINPTCIYHDVGQVLEGTHVKSSQDYLNAVRMWRLDRSGLGENVICGLRDAVLNAPSGDNVVVALELFRPGHRTVGINIGHLKRTHVVIFSDFHVSPRLYADHAWAFEIYAESSLYISGATISDCASYQGAAFLNFGVTVLEDTAVSNCHELSLAENDTPYECAGVIGISYGYLRMHNVTFSQNSVGIIGNGERCMHLENTAFKIVGHLQVSHVTFVDTYAADIFFDVGYLTDSSEITNLSFQSILSERSIFRAQQASLVIDGFRMQGCTGSSGLLVVSQTSRLARVVAIDNALLDSYGVILNLGKTEIVDSVILGTHTAAGSGRGSAIVNRGDLVLERIIMASNTVGALTSSYSVYIFSSEFRDNTASSLYSTIYSERQMVIDNCTFVDSSGVPTIVSEMPIILRNTVLPAGVSLSYVACGEILELADGTLLLACGFNANCTESAYSGVNCTCAPGHIGSPTVMCGPPAAVHVLPDTDVVGFVTKDDSKEEVVELLGLLSDGLGTVTWQIFEDTLPYWLRVSPQSGSFVNDDPCLSELEDLYISFNTDEVRANDTFLTGYVGIQTTSIYEENTMLHTVVLTVQLIVEVLASPTFSSVANDGTCSPGGDDDGVCEVEAGSIVSVVVDLRDSSGYSLGVGGTGFGVDPAPLASIDYENGTHVVTFEAPQTHFEIAVTLSGAHVQGSPLSYQVLCADGDLWDSRRGECVPSEVDIPRAAIAIGAAVTLVVGIAGVTAVKKRGLQVELQFLHKEASTMIAWIIVDLVDVGTDIGAFRSVSQTDSLSSYTPWYLVALCVALAFSIYSLRGRLIALRTIISDSVAPQQRVRCHVFSRPIHVAELDGIAKITDTHELDIATRRLQRKLRAHVLSVIGLFVEDVPMQVLNTIMLCTSGSNYPIEVLISTEITCILIGYKVTKLSGIRKIRDTMKRITSRVQQRDLKPVLPMGPRRRQ